MVFFSCPLSGVSGFIFEHYSTKSVRFESGLRDLLLQHIPHILQFSSGFWDDQQSWSDFGNRGSLGTVGCTQHPTFWLTTHDTAMLHSGHCDFPVFRSILRSLSLYEAFVSNVRLKCALTVSVAPDWAILLKSTWIHNQTVTFPHDGKMHLNHCNSHGLCKHYSFYVKHVKSRNCCIHYLHASWPGYFGVEEPEEAVKNTCPWQLLEVTPTH